MLAKPALSSTTIVSLIRSWMDVTISWASMRYDPSPTIT